MRHRSRRCRRAAGYTRQKRGKLCSSARGYVGCRIDLEEVGGPQDTPDRSAAVCSASKRPAGRSLPARRPACCVRSAGFAPNRVDSRYTRFIALQRHDAGCCPNRVDSRCARIIALQRHDAGCCPNRVDSRYTRFIALQKHDAGCCPTPSLARRLRRKTAAPDRRERPKCANSDGSIDVPPIGFVVG